MINTGNQLLPSQEKLLARLQHTSRFTGQAIILSGASGSGKTTLLKSLMTELDEYHSVFVSCPKFVASTEIRQKMLLQLISDPMVDDEVSLVDSLLLLLPSLTKPLQIIIDDAHFLPKELWAECLTLIQLYCGGRPINLILSVSPDAFLLPSVPSLEQLSREMKHQCLILSVEPLPAPDRKILFQALVGADDIIPNNFEGALAQELPQLPKEIVALFESLNPGDEADVDSEAADKGVNRALLISLITVSSLSLLLLVDWTKILGQQDEKESADPKTLTVMASQLQTLVKSNDVKSNSIKRHGTQESGLTISKRYNDLQGFALARHSYQCQPFLMSLTPWSYEPLPLKSLKVATMVQVPAELTVSQSAQEISLETMPVAQTDIHPQADAALVSQASKPEASKLQTSKSQISGSQTSKPHKSKPHKSKPQTSDSQISNSQSAGPQTPVHLIYTIQLIQVKQRDSLDRFVSKFAAETVNVVRYRQQWLVLAGDYQTLEQARKSAEALKKQYKLSGYWIRKWRDLKGHQVIAKPNNSENL